MRESEMLEAILTRASSVSLSWENRLFNMQIPNIEMSERVTLDKPTHCDAYATMQRCFKSTGLCNFLS